MAKPAKYTVKTVDEKMDAFIGFCESQDVEATDYRMIKFFGITPGELEKLRAANKLNNSSKHNGYAASLKKLDLFREDATIRRAISDPRLATHCSLKLRQPHWGGWTDKGEAARDVKVSLKMGDGGKDLAE
jgi:hypothetical protein